jgi:hypothetical protein
VSTQYIAVAVMDDITDEYDETLAVILSDPMHATLGIPEMGQLTILDDDPLPAVSLVDVPVSIPETGGVAWVTVGLSGPTEKHVAVDFATSDGTACAGADYAQTNGVLAWREGKGTNLTFAVPILDDEIVEDHETLEVMLFNPVNAVISGGPSRLITSIENDGVQPFAILFVGEDVSGAYVVLEWDSVRGGMYSIESTESLDEPFTALKVGIVGTPPVNVFVDTRQRVDRRFYRIVGY